MEMGDRRRKRLVTALLALAAALLIVGIAPAQEQGAAPVEQAAPADTPPQPQGELIEEAAETVPTQPETAPPPPGDPAAPPEAGLEQGQVEEQPVAPEPDPAAEADAGAGAEEGAVEEPAREQSSVEEPPNPPSDWLTETDATSELAQSDFRDNPCRSDPGSRACVRFLYPETCEGELITSADCRAFVDANPCTREPRGDGCRIFLENSCFERPTGPTCLFIVAALAFDTPCRQDPNSNECEQFLAAACNHFGLSGIDCSLFLFLARATRDEADSCHAFLDPRIGQPPRDSVCEVFIAISRNRCEDAPAVVCDIRFGGSRESLGVPGGDGGGGGGGTRLLAGRGLGGATRTAELLISDPGSAGDRGREERTRTVADRRGRSEGRLARTGYEVAEIALLGMLGFLGGALLYRRSRPRTERSAGEGSAA